MRAGAPGKSRGVGLGSGEHDKGQHVLGDSNAGAIGEGNLAISGNGVCGVEAQDRAWADVPPPKERIQVKSQNRSRVDGLTAKERVAGSSVKQALAAQQAEVWGVAFLR